MRFNCKRKSFSKEEKKGRKTEVKIKIEFVALCFDWVNNDLHKPLGCALSP